MALIYPRFPLPSPVYSPRYGRVNSSFRPPILSIDLNGLWIRVEGFCQNPKTSLSQAKSKRNQSRKWTNDWELYDDESKTEMFHFRRANKNHKNILLTLKESGARTTRALPRKLSCSRVIRVSRAPSISVSLLDDRSKLLSRIKPVNMSCVARQCPSEKTNNRDDITISVFWRGKQRELFWLDTKS